MTLFRKPGTRPLTPGRANPPLIAAMLVALGGCGGGAGSPSTTGTPTPPTPATALPGFNFTSYRSPAIPNADCKSAANDAAAITRVQFAQTVLLETSHPFFYLSAGRDTGLRVSITGSGAAPDVRVTAQANGTTLGSLCLGGPATLATASAKSEIECVFMAVRSPKKTGDLQSIRPHLVVLSRIHTSFAPSDNNGHSSSCRTARH